MSSQISKQIVVEELVRHIFIKSVVKSMSDECERRRTEIHVSDVLPEECLRRAYYSKRFGDCSDAAGMDSILAAWIGRQVHETPFINCQHELELKVSAIVDGVEVTLHGTADEVCGVGDDVVIVDKKTTRVTPQRPYDHHISQVTTYAAMYGRQFGKRVAFGVLLYINVATLEFKTFSFEIRQDEALKFLERLMIRAKVLQDAIRSGRAPAPEPGWICKYCAFVGRCAGDEFGRRV